jgi:hypothetical protein
MRGGDKGSRGGGRRKCKICKTVPDQESLNHLALLVFFLKHIVEINYLDSFAAFFFLLSAIFFSHLCVVKIPKTY